MQAFMTGRYRADGNIVLSQLLLYLFLPMDQTSIHSVRD
jgi:putative sterol carrier protein